jgi:hypothetical protein
MTALAFGADRVAARAVDLGKAATFGDKRGVVAGGPNRGAVLCASAQAKRCDREKEMAHGLRLPWQHLVSKATELLIARKRQHLNGCSRLRARADAGTDDALGDSLMLVRTTRAISTLALRGVAYLGLFVLVVVAHTGLGAALRSLGVDAGWALLAAGGAVLAAVIGGLHYLGRAGNIR